VSDFYSLLKQSIIERGISDAGERDEVYAQARRAMIRQLWAYQPALAEEDIERRVGDFDTTVERIEAELAAVFADPEGEPLPTEADAGGDRGAAFAAGRGGGRTGDDAPYHGKRPYHPMPPRADMEHAYAPPASRYAPPGREQAPADDDYDEMPRRRLPDRWAADASPLSYGRGHTGPRRRGWTLSEQDKVRLLVGAIGTLVLILVGLIVYLVLPAGDQGVTVAIDLRREVSDAATAARNATVQLDVQQTFVVFDGRDPTIFESAPDNPVRLDSDGGGGFARVSSSADSAGIKAVIGPGLATRLAGQRIRVTITARSSAERGAANMRFAYQSGLAISHWQTANLSSEYADVALIWRVPTQRTSSTGSDYLIIEPGIPGDGSGADVHSIKIDLLAPSSS
jgi:hypothetical protein